MPVNCPVCSTEKTDFLKNYEDSSGNFLDAGSLRECSVCGLVFAWPMPPGDDLARYYRESMYYEDKAPYAGDFYNFSYQLARSRLRLVVQHLPPGGGKLWLDVGAGNAILGYALKEMLLGASYDAVEPSATTSQGWGNWVSAGYGDLSDAPLETYDVITLNQVLEHVNRPITFLKEIAKHLVKGGLVYIDVPYRDDLFKSAYEPHLLFWDKGSLSFALPRAGLQALYCDSAGMKWRRARRYFAPTFIDRFTDPWRWVLRVNKAITRIGAGKQISTFRRFEADTYGGDRQWLRCLARKVG